IGIVATGMLAAPRLEAEAILVEGGRIAAIGAALRIGAGRADVVVDCVGTTVVPGLIDSHCHVVLGDYTPRQKTFDLWTRMCTGGSRRWCRRGRACMPPGGRTMPQRRRRWRSRRRSASSISIPTA